MPFVGNKRPWLLVAFSLSAITVAVYTIVVAHRGPDLTSAGQHLYFSDDDGKSWFIGSADKRPPFDHDGKQAACAHLFSCDGGHTKFIGYLMKYETPGDVVAPSPSSGGPPAAHLPGPPGALVKRTGDKGWLRWSDIVLSGGKIQPDRCPDGMVGTIIECYPD